MEEGCYVLSGEHVDVLGEVSPDGSLRKVHLEENGTPVIDVYAAIEIKCPFPSDRQLPVHYTLPAYYVCQCLAKMVVLHTDLLIYVSYSRDSTTFHKVHFSQTLGIYLERGRRAVRRQRSS